MRDGRSQRHARFVLRRQPYARCRGRGAARARVSRRGCRHHRRGRLFVASRGRRGVARRGVAARGGGPGGRAAAGARSARFGRYVPGFGGPVGRRAFRQGDRQRHLGRRARRRDVAHGGAARRALCCHAHEGRSAHHAVVDRLPPRHRHRGVRLLPAARRDDACRRHPAREHRARPRLRVRQDSRTELRAALRAAQALRAGFSCLGGCLAQVYDRQGATVLRVHDVREAVDTVRIFNKFRQ